MSQNQLRPPPPGRLLQRIAQRVAVRDTQERVLLPLLADMQHEYAQAQHRGARALVRARGLAAFCQVLAVASMTSAGRHLWANAWGTTEAEAHETERIFGRVAIGAALTTALLLVQEHFRLRHLRVTGVLPLLAPSALTVAISIGLVCALALSSDLHHARRQRVLVRIGSAFGLATFAIAAWLTPIANQEFRERVFRTVAPGAMRPLARGDREMTPTDLALRASQLRAEGRVHEAARFELEWHKKPALGVLSFSLVLSGASLAKLLRSRLLRFVAALMVATCAHSLLRVGEEGVRQGRLAPSLAMWGPVVAVAVVGIALLGIARKVEGTLARARVES